LPGRNNSPWHQALGFRRQAPVVLRFGLYPKSWKQSAIWRVFLFYFRQDLQDYLDFLFGRSPDESAQTPIASGE
jgi:hypothetical protein